MAGFACACARRLLDNMLRAIHDRCARTGSNSPQLQERKERRDALTIQVELHAGIGTSLDTVLARVISEARLSQ
jgi:hypothetical protein